MFDDLIALTELHLNDNGLTALRDGVFDNLTALGTLVLNGNPGAPFAPTAVAEPDSATVASPGGTVRLAGSAPLSGNPWGANVSYAWALTDPSSGVAVTFDDDAAATSMVTIPALPAGTVLTFTLTVTGRGKSVSAIYIKTATTVVSAVATVPGAPRSLSATASGTTTINLVWNAPASDGGLPITGYKIEVSSDSGSNWTDRVANTTGTNTSYAHTGLAGGDTRHYRVSAINNTGTGPTSNIDGATTPTTVLAIVSIEPLTPVPANSRGYRRGGVDGFPGPARRVCLVGSLVHPGRNRGGTGRLHRPGGDADLCRRRNPEDHFRAHR